MEMWNEIQGVERNKNGKPVTVYGRQGSDWVKWSQEFEWTRCVKWLNFWCHKHELQEHMHYHSGYLTIKRINSYPVFD